MNPNDTDHRNDRIDMLEGRVDKLESTISADLRRIFDKLEALTTEGGKTGVATAKDLCHVTAAHNATMLRVERLEIELIKLNQQKAWLLGAWTVVALVSSVIGAITTFLVTKFVK